ncbi:phosphoenolpyruvate carboxykinase (ATP) [Larkinella harenae]
MKTATEQPEKIQDLFTPEELFYQLPPEELIQQTLDLGQGELADTGALVVKTGEFTGRAPDDKFIVKDSLTEKSVDWNNVNHPIEEKYFDLLFEKVCDYFEGKKVWVRDCLACADEEYAMTIRTITETPWASLFCYNLFIRPEAEFSMDKKTDWLILQASGFEADPEIDGTRQGNFSIVNFSKRIILIGGSAYTGEIKKGIFSVLNYLLPHEENVLSMHCSANIGAKGDTAIFFGLSGTGKTTLSTDPDRKLIGDDEHGWSERGIFNIEGGCYAKCIDLDPENEPGIYKAIKKGALVENAVFFPNTKTINYEDRSITENTRVSYPIFFIDHYADPSVGPTPANLFFLTFDAYGILPPISKLTSEQAMYYFISGYTARIAGTEEGVEEPQSTFSACFGAPFMPLHPLAYAQLLREKIEQSNVNVWMINTGWTGGPYGIGERIKLPYTRAMINAALSGKLGDNEFETLPVFDLQIPTACEGVPAEILNPVWEDRDQYMARAKALQKEFEDNYKQYNDFSKAA